MGKVYQYYSLVPLYFKSNIARMCNVSLDNYGLKMSKTATLDTLNLLLVHVWMVATLKGGGASASHPPLNETLHMHHGQVFHSQQQAMWTHYHCTYIYLVLLKHELHQCTLNLLLQKGRYLLSNTESKVKIVLTMVWFTQIKPQLAAIMADDFHCCLSPRINMPWKYSIYRNNGIIIIFCTV